jgi:hypothetical protein
MIGRLAFDFDAPDRIPLQECLPAGMYLVQAGPFKRHPGPRLHCGMEPECRSGSPPAAFLQEIDIGSCSPRGSPLAGAIARHSVGV